jgi:bacteriocin-like protein
MNHRKEIDIMAKDLENKVEEISEDELDSVTGGSINVVNAVYRKSENNPIVKNAIYKQSLSGGQPGKSGAATKNTPGTSDVKIMMC